MAILGRAGDCVLCLFSLLAITCIVVPDAEAVGPYAWGGTGGAGLLAAGRDDIIGPLGRRTEVLLAGGWTICKSLADPLGVSGAGRGGCCMKRWGLDVRRWVGPPGPKLPGGLGSGPLGENGCCAWGCPGNGLPWSGEKARAAFGGGGPVGEKARFGPPLGGPLGEKARFWLGALVGEKAPSWEKGAGAADPYPRAPGGGALGEIVLGAMAPLGNEGNGWFCGGGDCIGGLETT